MLAKYKWWILGFILLAGGLAFYFHKKKKDEAAADAPTKQPPVAAEAEEGLVSNEEVRNQMLRNDIIGALN